MNKEITLPQKGRLLVVTDLHGDYDSYEKYLELWDKNDENSHIVLVGDMIHSVLGFDESVEILDDVIMKSRQYSNFHVLLGNHEWAHIINRPIYKSNKNLLFNFEKLVEIKKGSIQPTLDNYINFFKELPYFLKTDNGLFISHTGPSKIIKNIEDYEKILDEDYNNPILYDFLWNRPYGDYNEEDVENFLELMGKNCMIVGHTIVDGFKMVGKQMIITSNILTDNRTYLDIDLEKEIKNIDEIKK